MSELPQTDAERLELLRAAVTRSGLSDRRFATRVLTRNERTMRRWTAGDRRIPDEVLQSRWIQEPIPKAVLEWLDRD